MNGIKSKRGVRRAYTLAAGIVLAAASWLTAAPAMAQIGSERYSSIVTEAATGNPISSVSPDELRHPASLTKMMTLYMLFEAVRDRRIGLDQFVPVSAHAASMQPTKLGLRPGTSITVEEAILGLVTKSANDAASALGEMLGGSEDRFGQMMTLRARALGMSRTVFRNASGLPDPEQVTTARDLATLARRLIQDFPVEYRYFSTPNFVFHGRTIYNHDAMLQRYPGADGIKTGYIESSGHNLVTSAVRNNVRLIGVVLGASNNGERDIHMASLLDAGFDRMDVPALSRGEVQAWRTAPSLFPQAQAASVAPVPNILPAIQRATMRAPVPEPALHQPRQAAALFWGVQVGSYASEGAARQAANNARRAASGGDARVEQAFVRGRAVWRAQLVGLTELELRVAQAGLSRHRIPAQVLSPDSQRVASR